MQYQGLQQRGPPAPTRPRWPVLQQTPQRDVASLLHAEVAAAAIAASPAPPSKAFSNDRETRESKAGK